MKYIDENSSPELCDNVVPATISKRVRPKTYSRKHMARENRQERTAEEIQSAVESWHPKTRADCYNMPRPCLVVSCRHNLYLDVNTQTGSVKFNFPDKEIWELEETCSLDIAERGGVTLEDVGSIMNLTRERIRQLEIRGLRKLKAISESSDDGVKLYADFDPSAHEGDW